jgi:hypothetical protein
MPYEAIAALVLASVFAFSAAQKANDIRSFQEFVRPLVGHFSGMAGRAIIAAEVLLFFTLLLSVVEEDLAWAAGISSTTFLALAALSYATLLTRGDSTECHCFGRLQTSSASLNPALRASLFWLRTSALIALSTSVQGASARAAAALSFAIAAAICVGLLISMRRERLLLGRGPSKRIQELAPRVLRLQAHTWWVNGHPRSW